MGFLLKRSFYLILLSCALHLSMAKAQGNNSAKPWVFWYWMQAGVSKAGITADLEAMKTAGIGGAYLMSIKGATNPPLFNPPAVQLSPEWWGMVTFAMEEAKRLNLKIGMHVSDGFALAGGPWITPELSMQKIVSARVNIKGGTALKLKLPQPEMVENYYKDIAVYAYPSVAGAGISTQTVVPKVSTSTGVDASGLLKSDNKKSFGSAEPCWIQYEFEQPFTARTVTVRTSGNNYQAERLEIRVSEDGKVFRAIGRLEPPRHGWQDTDADLTHSIVPVTAKYYRFVYDKKGSEAGAEDLDAAKWKPSLKLLHLELSSEPAINQYEGKSGAVWRVSKRSEEAQIADQLCVPLNKILNITKLLKADGSLAWTAPKGNWTIIRIGHTSTGHKNATGGGGIGLESDKFNPAAIKLQFDSWYGEAIRKAGPELSAEVLTAFHVDSWECGSQNWSPLFAAEFQKRRGYDLMPYLPVMVGIPVQSADVSESFLYDLRLTIAELVVDQFYGTLAGLAKEKGKIFTAESVAPTMVSDGLMHYKMVDVPMGEFWLNSPTHDKPNDMMDAISGAHIYGKNIIQAEAFTTVRMDWNEHPGHMKTLQDRNYALGINKLVYHVFTHNPWVDRKPGMTLDGVGLYFQRDQTWWKQGKAWVDYAARSQQLLQQGKPVADIAVFIGEEIPRRSVLPDRLVPFLPGLFGAAVVTSEAIRLANTGQPLRQMPAGVTHSANMADPENWVNPLRGYAYDSFNPDVLMTAMVHNGNVEFTSGASYKVLVIPGKTAMNPNYKWMSLAVAGKLLELVKAGATIIVNEQPAHQPGLLKADHDAYNQVIQALWTAGPVGKGRVIKGPYQPESLDDLGLQRDLIVLDEQGLYAKKIAYTHRIAADKELYFIANQVNEERVLQFSFRLDGSVPQLYDAVRDQTISVKNWSNANGRTSMTLKLAPNASIFVIFNKENQVAGAKTGNNQPMIGGNSLKTPDNSPKTGNNSTDTRSSLLKNGNNWSETKVLQTLKNDWQVSFDAALGGPAEPVVFKELTDWSKNPDTLIKYYSGTASYKTSIKFDKKEGQQYLLDLGTVSNIAEVKVNGISCGVLWTAPFQADITAALKQGKNELIIEVTNTWANRLMGDQRLPESKRITKTTAPYRLEGKPLNPAGLQGPVRILAAELNDLK
ncbi:glycosyl hydrolase [Pedobacter sp. PLR]|uniref:glycosyl hydrolase n=1 Tax=Pedobacter sp. PLR TaxID=2994465 RepID=UPI002245286D|nr:glycosyl hydrolase [Pedobacter sp. PLR]MCX2452499.1 glycosyl hydrolase [Pedobacter sp. PLR]